MTYGAETATIHGNTLYEKLHAQYGERAARSVSLGLEANAKKEARRRAAQSAAARPASRPIPQSASARPASRTIPQSRPQDARTAPQSAARQNGRAHAHDKVLSEPRASRVIDGRTAAAYSNPYRARINYMKRPVTGRSDLEISIATFPQAYKAGMKAKRAIGAGLANRHGAAHTGSVRRGYRPGEQMSAGSALDRSRGTMSEAYRLGERMRRVTQIETARPTPANAKGIEVPKGFAKFRNRARVILLGKAKPAVETKVRHSPFPIATLALIAVCLIVVMVMISTFAEMSDYRSSIADLESKQSSLEIDRARLSGLVENREDIRVIERIATEEIGMVSADLAQARFVSLADYDSVEIIKKDTEEKPGVFASIFSAISENLGSISDYIN